MKMFQFETIREIAAESYSTQMFTNVGEEGNETIDSQFADDVLEEATEMRDCQNMEELVGMLEGFGMDDEEARLFILEIIPVTFSAAKKRIATAYEKEAMCELPIRSAKSFSDIVAMMDETGFQNQEAYDYILSILVQK